MVRSLFALLARVLNAAPLLELAGAVMVVASIGVLAGAAWAVLAAGVGLLLKAAEVESRAAP